MPSLRAVESRIQNVEGFRIAVYWHHGGDARSDLQGFPIYPFTHAASGSATVAAWKRTRFHPLYPGFDVEVLDHRGYSVSGNMKLATLRSLYEG